VRNAAAVTKVLNLGAPPSSGIRYVCARAPLCRLCPHLHSHDCSGAWGEQWKVLIYDKYCRDVISPLVNVAELRKQGITLHMMLDSEREEIPDVPAIYFVQPTKANIARICQDCVQHLYTSMHLHFVSPLPRALLEELAQATLASNSVSQISKIYDQTLDFITLEPNLFSLKQANSYFTYNNPKVQEAEAVQWMERITQGLFSVLATFGVIPVIRCPTNCVAEEIAQKLHDLLRTHLSGRSHLFPSNAGGASYQRPVLILLDRNQDLVTPVHHTATYKALVDDLLTLQMNRVTITGDDGQKKTYDLDVSNDAFYAQFGGCLFPEAIDANMQKLAEVSEQEKQIKENTTSGNEQDAAKGIMEAVTSLPMLMEKKKGLEAHTAILQAAMNHVVAREVPTLHEISDTMVSTSHADKAKLLEIISDPTKGTLQDKVRVLVVAHLATSISDVDMAELEAALAGAVLSEQASAAPAPGQTAPTPVNASVLDDLKVLTYLKKHKHFKDSAMRAASSSGGAGAGNVGSALKTALGGKLLGNVTAGLAGQAKGLLAQASASVKNFLPRDKQVYATKVAAAICENKPTPETESFKYLDPKVKVSAGQEVPRQRAPFCEAIVFVIGSGNYTEYQNLVDYSETKRQTGPMNITYGCSEMLNAEGFLKQLKELGKLG
jgi:hypothetical protein